jgi:hypothetical protein
MKIIVISEAIYKSVNQNEQRGGPGGNNYKICECNENTWYFTSGEGDSSLYQYYLDWAYNNNVDVILIHRGTDDSYYNNLKNVQKGDARYARIKILGFHITDTKLCEGLKNCDIETVEREIDKNIRIPWISDIKHQIVNLLEPIRIDIEGLIDKDFEDKYWNSVSNAWENGNIEIKKVFEQVRQLVYDKNKDTIEKIISEKGLDSKTWKKIEENLLPNLTGDENVNKLLNALQSGNKKEVQNIIELHGNVYKQWMDKLINAIDQLINELGQ